MTGVLVLRLAAAGPKGVPYRDDRAQSAIIGVTEELGDGEHVWFRALSPGPGGRLGDQVSRDPVLVEIRESGRARARVEEVTGFYRAKGWVFAEDPRQLDVSDPPLDRDDVLAGWPLQAWAAGVVEQFGGAG